MTEQNFVTQAASKHPRVSLSALFLGAFLGGAACSSPGAAGGDGDGDGDGDTPGDGDGDGDAAGGTASGGGAATGGTGPGTGGGSTGGQDGGTGGSSSGFTCPTGLTGMVPTLTGLTVTPIDTPEANTFFEGPVWAGGALYLSQLENGGSPAGSDVLKLNGSALESAFPDAGTNGLAVRADGKIIGASQVAHGLIVLDPANPPGIESTLVDMYNSLGFNSPNDLTIRSDGNIYFTDPDWNCGGECPQGGANNRTYHVSPEGVVTPFDEPHSKPNGIALSPDENTLYVAGDSTLTSYALMSDGSVGAGSPFAGGSLSSNDGLGIDCAGNVYITSGQNVQVRTPAGQTIGEISAIDLGGGVQTTNVAFGGPNNQTLYVTSFQGLYSVELDLPGYPY